MNQPAATGSKVLIMAGGTGGHIYPALTIARDLIAAGASVEWLGTCQGLEARIIGNSDIPLHFISIGGLRGKGIGRLLLAPFAILRAVVQALGVIRRSKPCCVLGMGGFVTGPGGVAARLLGKPLLIHEQNAIAGLSNLLLFPLARVVMEAFPGAFRRKRGSSRGFFARLCNPAKIRVVGNPVRSDILSLPPASERSAARSGPLRLLVLGGSLGAAAINDMVPALLAALPAPLRPLVRHQCGDKHLTATLEAYRKAGITVGGDVDIQPYIENMAAAYAWADLALCRAGASTIAELATTGLPAILVPYPWAVDDHQRANAAVLADKGAAWLLPQSGLSVAALQAILGPLQNERSALLPHVRAAEALASRDASRQAVSLCLEACHG
ncbi:MAG: undecaprenyldiphospho-muramoylpentapeptide beta-N-acetylglucosaminyltransferase [Pseudohongiellaceae bacterium]